MARDTIPSFPPGFALISGVLAVSTGAIFARIADSPALVTAAYRLGLACLVLAPLTWHRSRDELLKLSPKDILPALLSGFFLALHFATWIASLDYTSVANSVVLVNTIPLWVGLLTPFITGERIHRVMAVGIAVSVIGGGIIGIGDFASGPKALLGDALALAGGICAAVYLLLGRNLRRRLSLFPYIFICYSSAAVFLWIAVLALRLPVTGYAGGTWVAFCGSALVSQLIGHTSYNWALKYFSAGLIAVALLGEPIGSTVLAYFLFGESFTWSKIIGGVIILLAVYLASRGEIGGLNKKRPNEKDLAKAKDFALKVKDS